MTRHRRKVVACGAQSSLSFAPDDCRTAVRNSRPCPGDSRQCRARAIGVELQANDGALKAVPAACARAGPGQQRQPLFMMRLA